MEESEIDDLHFHDLRHTFAKRLRAANVHEYDIAHLLGHSTRPSETRNTEVTRGYAHGVPQRLKGAVDSLEEGKTCDFGYANFTPSPRIERRRNENLLGLT